MSSKPVIILGTGGHAKVVTDALKLSGRKIVGFITLDMVAGSYFCDEKILGNDSEITKYLPDEIELINGVGALPGKSLRWELADKMRKQGYSFATVIHPTAVIASDVILEEGVQIMAGAVIQAGTKIGKDSIINTGTLIDHDCKIYENCQISPGVVLSGGVIVEKNSYIGTGAKIIQNITLKEECVVAAGTIIYKDVSSKTIVRQQLNTVMEGRST